MEETRSSRNKVKTPLLPKSRAALFFWFFGGILFFECVVRIVAALPFFGVGLLFIVLFSAAFALFLTAVCGLLPRRAAFISAHVFLGLLTAVYVVQMFYYFMFKTFLTFFSIINGTDALQFGGNIRATLAQTWPLVILLFAPGVLFIVFCRKLSFDRSPKAAVFTAGLAAAAHIAAIACLFAFGIGYFTPYDYYYHNQSLNQSVDRLGLLTTFRLDIQRYLSRAKSVPAEAEPNGTPAAAPVRVTVPRPSPTPAETPKPGAQAKPAPAEYGYNVLDIDFNGLIAQTDDAELQELHRYFSEASPTRQNEYTGIYEGYNLITVTAESLAPYAIDPALTPTLYKMAREGYDFTNFYCPEWGVSTSDGEYVNCLGLVPKSGVWSLYLSGKRGNALPFALGNQFSRLGYLTNAYHNNTYTYYSRDISHPNMGYTYKGLGGGLEIDETWPESDLQMADVTTGEYIVDGRPFHTYYVTVSGHMAYTWEGNAMSSKHRGLVEGLPLSEHAKAYLACNIELDRAMELLLRRLEEAGVAEKTVIAISPDHPPYGLTREEIGELAGHDVEGTFEYAKSTFILYNPGMEPKAVEKPCCSLDILPTLSNLFGLPYDSRLLMGRDIFSDAEPLVILGDRSWATDKASFDSGVGEVVPSPGQTADDAYVQGVNRIVADKFKYSPQILDYDYYRVVFGRETDG